MVSGSAVLEFGTRNLALHSGLSQRTVSRLLRFLCGEPDPLLDVVTRGRMARADRFALRIPDRYRQSVRWRRRRAGRIDEIHPAFLVLGGTGSEEDRTRCKGHLTSRPDSPACSHRRRGGPADRRKWRRADRGRGEAAQLPGGIGDRPVRACWRVG